MLCHRCGARPAADAPDQRFCPKDGLLFVPQSEHDKSPRDMFLGTLVGDRYPILGIVGHGGMGAVYLSEQSQVEREVAVKMVRPGGGPLEAMLKKRFRREAKAIAKVSHPCIVTLHDFGVEDDGTAYMVLELVKGKTLSEAFQAEEVSRKRLTRLALEVLEALETAHGAGLIHRDLKPENIMLLDEPSAHYTCKVLDFGLAKLAAASGPGGRLTRTGAVFGTPQYMAPEQARGEAVDERTDLYALGVILYEGLAGCLPFDHEQPWAIAKAHITDTPPPLPDDLPPGLGELVNRALAKAPGDRQQSAAEMASELRSCLAPTAVTPLKNRPSRPAEDTAQSVDTAPDDLSPRETEVLETLEAGATEAETTQVVAHEAEIQSDERGEVAQATPQGAGRFAAWGIAAAVAALGAIGWLLAVDATPSGPAASGSSATVAAPAPMPPPVAPIVTPVSEPAPAPEPTLAAQPESAPAVKAAKTKAPPRSRPARKAAKTKKLQVPRRTLGR